ncbi:sigma 54-interacting transcriptional regulator [Pedobacter rhizosphaerae]|uniref:Response regulator receiver domain-containing protein n=1 Tax=Pedobacter rhizosphaerae TaxID=390241 RepID=A0A1H9VDG5_9SPHI|nr:sigma 54-interacting transcriptional regulator [Pedobacter rhizosphaerae]SES19333.1 Response regulator receiver domain-containing protein [Pedobacter rhizosphaerae]
MTEKILIVEDEFIVAHDLQMILQRAGYQVVGIADSVKQAEAILEKQAVDLVLLDIYLKGRLTGIDLARHLMKIQIPFIYISANSNEKVLEAAKSTSPYGFIVKPYRDRDILLSIDIARYRKENSHNMKTSSERFMQDFIVDISMKSLTWQKKIIAMASAFQPYIPFDFIVLSGIEKDGKRYREIGITRENFDQYGLLSVSEFMELTHLSSTQYANINQLLPETTTDCIYIGDDFENVKKSVPMKNLIANTYQLNANLVKTFYLENGDQISFSFYSRTQNIYQQAHMELLSSLSATLEKKLAHIIDLEKVGAEPVNKKPDNILPPAKTEFENIIGKSTAILSVLDKIKIVAPTNTSVLITGESGTGKEEIAKSLHRLSQRNTKPMVAVNCAALPFDLIESILFGHEKGAFTGAVNTRIGKFEEANGGTIFLDEIGEMPFDLQAKLLRALQEKEIERIGGKQPIAVDLRIIAATNLHLEKEIAKGRFRLDLFYRLNVFPIHIPPLWQRKTDIPLLAEYFVNKHAKVIGKSIPSIPSDFLDRLLQYDWPGNIRELEHIILRSILLASNGKLNPNDLELGMKHEEPGLPHEIKTINDNERDHIIRVLALCKGRVAGSGGAAELLGVPATTLNSKIKKLDIKR